MSCVTCITAREAGLCILRNWDFHAHHYLEFTHKDVDKKKILKVVTGRDQKGIARPVQADRKNIFNQISMLYNPTMNWEVQKIPNHEP